MTEPSAPRKTPLWVSAIATISVAAVPTFVAVALFIWSQAEPMVLAAVLAAILLTALAAMGASLLWSRQPESVGYPFGDLMLWSWVRQRHSERAIADALETLGFDRSARFLGHSTASPDAQLRAMHTIAKALDAKSSYTLGHTSRVERHVRKVAEELELPEDERTSLALAAALHDVGNVSLPENVLRKAGEITLEERAAIEAHVLIGSRLVTQVGDDMAIEGIRHHHERWDGGGYPDGLRGEQIPLAARVVAIGEAYDAMTSTRPYRQGLTQAEAIDVLRAESGSQFDGELVEVFISTLPRWFASLDRIPFLAAARDHLRELLLVLRRVGAVALSATASTIAIALILGSTVLSPGTAPAPIAQLPDRQADPIDRVLGMQVAAGGDGLDLDLDGDAASRSSESTQEADDRVLGSRVSLDGGTGGTVDGLDSDTGTGGPGPVGPGPGPGPDGPGPVGPGPGPGPGPDGPGPDPDPDPDPGGGPDPDPDPDPGGGPNEQPPPEDPKDKNPDANGNGNAHGHDKDNGNSDPPGNGNSNSSGDDAGGPGNSENAPGHNDDAESPGNSDKDEPKDDAANQQDGS